MPAGGIDVGTARADLANGMCPICGKGPFVIVASHVNRIHAINPIDFRLMLGFRVGDSITTSDVHETISDRQHRTMRRHPKLLAQLKKGKPAGGAVVNRSPQWERHMAQFTKDSAVRVADIPPRFCDVSGCDRLHTALGMCNLHYRRTFAGVTPPQHGLTGYMAYKCRCDVCLVAGRAYHRRWQGKKREEVASGG